MQMKVITRYCIPKAEEVTKLVVPAGGDVVDFMWVSGAFYLWMIEPVENNPATSKDFIVVSTGTPVEMRWRYLGTAHDHSTFTWHLFEMKS